ncbi:MAG: D-alanine--D-alanine ligase [Bacteroidia bacterium]|nr:D-alanine--D-alanine ligase [Bacteroidia bacterium]NNJ55650.1 D-alanine--D-alanine ligase [Bacteroidia bacterium]
MARKAVGILFGGKSTEHEVSIRSARNIAKAVDRDKFETILIGVSKKGNWFLKTEEELMSEDIVKENEHLLQLIPGSKKDQILKSKNQASIGTLDVVFSIIHGTGGEDGTIQGLFKIINIPFVGPGVLSSSVCLDKEVTKRLLRDSGIPNANFLSYLSSEKNNISFENVKEVLGMPVYVKPPNLGSSVGISKVSTKEEFDNAIDYAFKFDRKVLIEQNVKGREIECAVLGNSDVKASLPGEVVTVKDSHEFYSYEAKYIDANGSITKIPADLPQTVIQKVQDIAIKAYTCLCCEGMARIDVFVTENEEIIVNEINTIPGFTDISMYPKLWEETGISYSNLITKLLELAIDRYNEEEQMTTSV